MKFNNSNIVRLLVENKGDLRNIQIVNSNLSVSVVQTNTGIIEKLKLTNTTTDERFGRLVEDNSDGEVKDSVVKTKNKKQLRTDNCSNTYQISNEDYIIENGNNLEFDFSDLSLSQLSLLTVEELHTIHQNNTYGFQDNCFKNCFISELSELDPDKLRLLNSHDYISEEQYILASL